MARPWIGTSGWNYKHWRDRFYPRGLAEKDWLAYYAERFPTVELNYTHYRRPSAQSWKGWREGVPDGFRFAVKAHRFLTHRKRLIDPSDSLKLVIKDAKQLGDKLGPILYQLPPYFRRGEVTAARLEAFLELLPGDCMHAIEFRHDSWFTEETLRLLRRFGVAFCFFDGLEMEPPVAATARYAYARFHGPQKYGGRYPRTALRKWADRLESLGRDVDDLYVYFNNDARAYAVANALTLAAMMGAPYALSGASTTAEAPQGGSS